MSNKSYGEEADPPDPRGQEYVCVADVEKLIAEALKKERNRTAEAIRKVAKFCCKPSTHTVGELEHILYELADQL